MKTHLWVLCLLGVAVLAVAACGGKESKAATPTAQQVLPSPTKVVTASPSLTPTATATAQGLPFSEVKFKSGDWAKYQMGTTDGAAAQPQGTLTLKVAEIAFGGTTYEGQEAEMAVSAVVPAPEGTPIPGYPTGSFVSVNLTEKGKTGGKSWNVSIFGQQVQCFPGAASGSPEQINIGFVNPQGMTFTTDTYKVPDGGRVIKVWKYRADGGEVWLSNEVPMYTVKITGMVEGQTTNLELLAYGSGAPLSVTSAALEASCK